MTEFEFDFDNWARLAKDAPQEFEKQRRHLIDEQLVGTRNINRLRGIQFRIDMERSRASRGVLSSCLHLYGLMWERFIDLDTELTGLWTGDTSSAQTQPTSNIIPFALKKD